MIEEPVASWLLLVGRISLASVFLVSGIHKGVWYQEAVAEFRIDGVAWIVLTLPATIALHVIASTCLILGFETQIAALLLAVFTLVATFKVHGFWRLPKAQQLGRSRLANANLAIVGGLLIVAATGPGTIALSP